VVALRELVRQRDFLAAGSDARLADWLEHWLGTIDVGPRTYISYEGHVRRHIVKGLGGVKLRALTPTMISGWLGTVTSAAPQKEDDEDRPAEDRPLSPGTRTRILATLRVALAAAVDDELLERNPAALVKPPRVTERKAQAMTTDQVRAFLDGTRDDRLAALYLLAVTTGMRQGELLGLRWDDIEGDRIAVRGTLARLDGRYVLVPPKSRREREVRVGPATVAALRAHRARQAEERLAAGSRWMERGLVFCRADGEALNGSVVTHAFSAHLTRLGLPPFRFHDLRHTANTLLIEATGDVAAAATMLGHSSWQMTQRYTHVQEAQLERAAEVMEAVVR
jgi:integrase